MITSSLKEIAYRDGTRQILFQLVNQGCSQHSQPARGAQVAVKDSNFMKAAAQHMLMQGTLATRRTRHAGFSRCCCAQSTGTDRGRAPPVTVIEVNAGRSPCEVQHPVGVAIDARKPATPYAATTVTDQHNRSL